MSDERWVEIVAMWVLGGFSFVAGIVWIQDVRRRRRDERNN